MSNVEKDSIWSLYLILCADNSYYTGITTDVKRRFEEHQSGKKKSARYLRGRGPLELVWHQVAGNQSTALRLEHRLRKLPQVKKKALAAGKLKLADLMSEDEI